MKCAVTGANGYLGRRLKEYFENQGWDVLGLSRKGSGQRHGKAVFFDLKGRIEPDILRQCDILVHCAYDFSVRRWEEIVEINVNGSINLFHAARAAGVQKIIFISSISSFANCKSMYGRAKFLIEGEAQKCGAFIVRPGLIYDSQPGVMFSAVQKSIAAMPLVGLIGRGEQLQYLVHSEDLCRLIFMLATTGAWLPKPITAAHEKAITFKEIVQTMAEAAGRRVVFVPFPERFAYWGLRAMELSGLRTRLRADSLVGLLNQNPAPSFSEMRQFDFRPREFSIASLKAV